MIGVAVGLVYVQVTRPSSPCTQPALSAGARVTAPAGTAPRTIKADVSAPVRAADRSTAAAPTDLSRHSTGLGSPNGASHCQSGPVQFNDAPTACVNFTGAKDQRRRAAFRGAPT